MRQTDDSRRGRRPAPVNLAAALAALQGLTYAELQAEWRRLYRSPPPKKVSRDVLELGIAWKLQEAALGGLSAAVRRQLSALAEAAAAGDEVALPRAVNLKVGARLVREWNGETHDVLVLEKGFHWRGEAWPSLSAIAREITGARWSGPRFFGIPASGNRRAVERVPSSEDRRGAHHG